MSETKSKENLRFLIDRLNNGTPNEKACVNEIMELAADRISASNPHEALIKSQQEKNVNFGYLGTNPDPKLLKMQTEYLDDLEVNGTPVEKQMVTWCVDKTVFTLCGQTLSGTDLLVRKQPVDLINDYVAETNLNALSKATGINQNEKMTPDSAAAKLEQILVMALNIATKPTLKAFDFDSINKKETSKPVKKAEPKGFDSFDEILKKYSDTKLPEKKGHYDFIKDEYVA